MREYGNVYCRQRGIRNHGVDFWPGFGKSHDSGEPGGFAQSLAFGEPYADGDQDGAAGETGTEEDSAGCSSAAEAFDERACRRAGAHDNGELSSAQQRGDVL
jgi:hypothetical protein